MPVLVELRHTELDGRGDDDLTYKEITGQTSTKPVITSPIRWFMQLRASMRRLLAPYYWPELRNVEQEPEPPVRCYPVVEPCTV